MNINDVMEQLPEVPDMLEALFKYQEGLLADYLDIEEEAGLLQTRDVPVDLDDPAGQARLKDLTWRVVEELGEAMNCLKNKPWKQSPISTDVDHYYEELADALHFFLELLISSGLTAKKTFALYFLKMNVNKFRQESKY